MHECKEEVDASVSLNKKSSFCHQANVACRPLSNLDRLGLLDEQCVLAHMVHLTEEDIEMAARRQVNVAHCPTSNMKLASGFCPVSNLINAGVNVCLGTDGAASNNSLDMIAEIKMAALLAKGLANDATTVPAAMALRMATINGAKALGLVDKVGSIEVGKYADLMAVDLLNHTHCRPVYDPISAFVYAATRECVSHVWVNGVLRVEKGKLLNAKNESAQRLLVETWRDKIYAVEEELNTV